jgi:4-hydroxy-2-oxoheptanedioate aldolase
VQTANDHTLLVVLVEDIVAVGNLDDILDVDHIDVFFVAPTDLASSMGHMDNVNHPEVQQTIDETIARIQSRGRVAGTLTTDGNVEKYAADGVQFLFVSVGPWITAGAHAFMERAKNA